MIIRKPRDFGFPIRSNCVGQHYGDIFRYKMHTPEHWTRHLLGKDSPSDVGGVALDVDGNGWIDFVAGGAWYRNSRNPDVLYTRFAFDAELRGVHDVVAADIDGDGQPEILTMSDQNNLRWYKIPADPTQPWTRHDVGPAVHAGIAVGDLTGNGALDIVRTNVWFENVNVFVDGDVTGNGLPDIIAKPWNPRPDNALGGKMFVMFLAAKI